MQIKRSVFEKLLKHAYYQGRDDNTIKTRSEPPRAIEESIRSLIDNAYLYVDEDKSLEVKDDWFEPIIEGLGLVKRYNDFEHPLGGNEEYVRDALDAKRYFEKNWH